MRLPENQPAKTYDVNILSSLIGRCYLKNLSKHDHESINGLIEEVLRILALDKPVVPHTDPALLKKFKAQLTRICQLAEDQQVQRIIENLIKDLQRSIQNLLNDVHDVNPTDGFSITLAQIEEMLGMKGAFNSALEVAKKELKDKDEHREHPAIPQALNMQVSIEETRRLIEYVIGEIFLIPIPKRWSASIINDPRGHHLFWATTENLIQYATPDHYDLATQFSFDIPHNAAHIAHLGAHENLDVSTYIDTMSERSFFESVAVLSEHQIIKLLKKNSHTAKQIHSKLDENRKITVEELHHWMLADRIFEARLRVARLLGDCFTLERFSSEETTTMVSNATGLDLNIVRNEILKYYTVTGLGGVYVLGSNRMMAMGIENPKDAIVDTQGKVIRSWEDFNQKFA